MANEREIIKNQILDRIYPLTIVADRYNGSYSNAKYLAFNMDHENLPMEIGGGDSVEMNFWHKMQNQNSNNNILIGKGNTPNEALEELGSKIYSRNKVG